MAFIRSGDPRKDFAAIMIQEKDFMYQYMGCIRDARLRLM